MAVTQYIGARYVPLFADPAEWSNDRTYEPLTIVLHQGNSYTSRQFVPKGIQITDARFWAETGNYNAQVEQYRQEVLTVGGRMDAVETAVTTETTRATAAEQANANAISAETTRATAAERANADAISAEVTRATAAEQANADAISAETNRATTAEQANADAISGEVTRATAAEQALDARLATAETKAAAYPNTVRKSLTDFVGLCTHDLASAAAAKYAEYGFNSVRLDLTWADVERTAGVYDFTAYDQIVQNAAANGLSVMFILDYNNTLYASSATAKISNPTNRTAFVNFAKAAVAHFDTVDEWEIWNEPDHQYKEDTERFTPQEYYDLIVASYDGIKQVRPSAMVIAGSLSSGYTMWHDPRNWWWQACALGILDYCDKVSMHDYSSQRPIAEPEVFVYDDVVSISAINTKFAKKQMPLIVTECGYTTEPSAGYNPTDETRAAWLMREMLLYISCGVERAYVYEGHSGYTTTNREAYFGMFDEALQPTVTAGAMRTLNENLAGKTFILSLTSAEGRHSLQLLDTSTSEIKYASWTSGGASRPTFDETAPADAFLHMTTLELESRVYAKCGASNPGRHAEMFNDSNAATGYYSHAEGKDNTTDASWSHVGGSSSTITDAGEGSFVHGLNCRSRHTYAGAIGSNLDTGRNHQFVCGEWNWREDDALLVVGNGSDATHKDNAFWVKADGIHVKGQNGGPAYHITVDSSGNVIAVRD